MENNNLDSNQMTETTTSAKLPLLAGVLTSLGASICCLGPFLLLSLGIGGAWIARLTALDPLRPYFIGLTLLLLALGFRRLYLVPSSCAPGSLCSNERILKDQRLMFWITTVVLLSLLAVPWLLPVLYR